MNIKNEKGITLVALVVTIVVMIILASIAISASVGDNGVILQTKQGVINSSKREVEEALGAYILLKDKELIKKGTFTGVTISALVNSGVVTLDDDATDTYIINLNELDVKGDYGRNGNGVFKVNMTSTSDYTVFYVDNAGVTY